MAESFFKRLSMAIAEMPNPVKDTKAYNYKYETLAQVLAIVQPALLKHGLFVTQGMECVSEDKYELRTLIYDAESDTPRMVMDCRPVFLKGDSQKDGSSETYARRYALKTVFGLAGEDDDGAAASEPREHYKKPVERTQKPQQQQPQQHTQQPTAGVFEHIKTLKEQAIANGVKPDGIDAWYSAKFGTTSLNKLTPAQLNEVVEYLESLVTSSEEVLG